MASQTLTKYDLIDSVREKTKREKYVVQGIIDAFLNVIKEELESGNAVMLRGFGTFEPRLRKGRDNARNPRTGETLSVASRYAAVFKPGQELKQAVAKLPVPEADSGS